MSSREFSRWQYFFKNRSWGFDVDGMQVAQICSVIANFSGLLERKNMTKPSDFYRRAE